MITIKWPIWEVLAMTAVHISSNRIVPEDLCVTYMCPGAFALNRHNCKCEPLFVPYDRTGMAIHKFGEEREGATAAERGTPLEESDRVCIVVPGHGDLQKADTHIDLSNANTETLAFAQLSLYGNIHGIPVFRQEVPPHEGTEGALADQLLAYVNVLYFQV